MEFRKSDSSIQACNFTKTHGNQGISFDMPPDQCDLDKERESSDYVVLPSHLKPKRSNILGYYIFRITSDISDRWVYCRVIDWTKEEHDCYLPTVREWDCFNRIVDDELPGDSEQL